ncbi:shikimate kinase [Thermophilibacter provencensis]|uniref:Shikimate kinase n=1 Tax=Thermophilibacter provencensis TaxID=1852386 RepID=A0ABT7V2R5_9ACTN|nr:shikimate kinase [Thermophilibacter provencensis]MDM8270905.1 shikimate kinase [Thermophilibacter provencensis]
MAPQSSAAAPYGLIGHPLGHSWSPQIHARLGSVPYDLHDLDEKGAEDLILRGAWRGLNVTIPHKRLAAGLADERSSRVDALGVANTLVRRPDGSIFAENTDVLGFSLMLERFFLREHGVAPSELLANRTALVLGSGGASRAVRAALEETGARVVVVSRSGNETYEGLVDRRADAVLIVNTTPVGMFPACPSSPLDEETLASFHGLLGVLDVVYNPCRTGLCLAAERLGIPSESGLAMLVGQALFASELFQARALDRGLVGAIEREIRLQTQNVVLIGMPGAGKSSCGRALARLLGRPFVDIDDALELECGRSAAQIIREDGEDAFRSVETAVTGSYGARSGLVIACGGGVVTRPENYDLIHQNGLIVFLDRPIEELSSSGRPVSQAKGVERLAEERMGLYRAWADLTVRCTGSAEGDAEAVRGLFIG